jgi:hypothetical protein
MASETDLAASNAIDEIDGRANFSEGSETSNRDRLGSPTRAEPFARDDLDGESDSGNEINGRADVESKDAAETTSRDRFGSPTRAEEPSRDRLGLLGHLANTGFRNL